MKPFRAKLSIKNNLLIERREALGMTQVGLSQACGVEQYTIGDFECLRVRPLSRGRWTQRAIAVADYFGVAPEDLWPAEILSIKHPTAIRLIDSADVELLISDHQRRLAERPDEAYDRRGLLRTIDFHLEALRPREREVVERRFGLSGRKPQTYEEIGTLFDVSGSRVAQIEAYALRKIRRLEGSSSRPLRKYLKGYVGSCARTEAKYRRREEEKKRKAAEAIANHDS